ncbi:MAG: enoyl-CoA hydratase/isomerase family protein [Proteobacteria bacterium]|nr:enoyl-CoA hydratase/isomerase family protein [Pseudomonadota bacterium]
MSNNGYVTHSCSDEISVVEFFHPRSNSLPGALLRELAEVLKAAHLEPHSRVILLRSGGEGAFCAGASFDELRGITDIQSGERFFSGFAQVILAMIRGPKPVVTRVHGKAVGGGVGVVAASDYAVANSSAQIRLSEIAIGIGPFTIGPAVERKIGCSAFAAAGITGDWRNASWALDNGLYHEIHEGTAAMDAAIAGVLSKLRSYSPQALRELKRCSWEGTEGWEVKLLERAGISAELLLTSEAQAAITAVSQSSVGKAK